MDHAIVKFNGLLFNVPIWANFISTVDGSYIISSNHIKFIGESKNILNELGDAWEYILPIDESGLNVKIEDLM